MPVSEAQKKASVKYLEKLDEVRIRMPKGKKDDIKAAAAAAGESMNQYIINAVDQRTAHDAIGTAGCPQDAGVIQLPPDTIQAAQEAAEAAGETLPQFIDRAIEETADRDVEPQEAVFSRAVDFLAEYFKMNRWDFIKELEQIKKKASGKTTRKTKGGKPNE